MSILIVAGRTTVVRDQKIDPMRYGIGMCPLCGKPVTNTGRICYEHFNLTYDGQGYIISWQEWKP